MSFKQITECANHDSKTQNTAQFLLFVKIKSKLPRIKFKTLFFIDTPAVGDYLGNAFFDVLVKHSTNSIENTSKIITTVVR